MFSQTGVADCIRSISDAMSALDNFSRQLEEFWRSDSEHYAEIVSLSNDKASANQTNNVLMTQVFSADRHAQLLQIVKRKFTDRENLIKGTLFELIRVLTHFSEILIEQKRLKSEALRRKATNRPITPPPMAPTPTIASEVPQSLVPTLQTTPLPVKVKKEKKSIVHNGEPAPKVSNLLSFSRALILHFSPFFILFYTFSFIAY